MTKEELLQVINVAVDEGWTQLDLTGRGLTSLPPEIGRITSLNALYLSYNQLKAIPSEIIQLSNLKVINLYQNRFEMIPPEIMQISSLTNLYINENELNIIHPQIRQMTKLRTLNLSHNNLKNVPSEIGQLSNLTSLNLSNNKLTTVPSDIGQLSNLTSLKLSDNYLSSIPSEIGHIVNLAQLDLSFNRLSIIPPEIGQLDKLQEFYLGNNPIQSPPPEILNLNRIGEADPIKIRRYFQQLFEAGEYLLFEAKLLIVGEPGAGKTSLARKIQDDTAPMPLAKESTKGVDVHPWVFKIPQRIKEKIARRLMDEDPEFRINIWDFGGQEIYHATHQFFLTPRSLYILVADAREQKTDFDFWLHAVKALSGSSPLLIVVNEKDGRQWHIDSGRLNDQFGNLAATRTVDLKTNIGLANLIETIKYQIIQLPHIGDTLPGTWVNVRRALENDSRPYIPLQTYLEICKANGFTRLDDKLQLSGYLHDLGVYLHFQDDDILKRTLILDPEWGTDAVYRILDNKQVINNQGHFSREDLEIIWDKEEYSFMGGDLLALMMKFQLCYEIPDQAGQYIAPQLLSQKPPAYKWSTESNLILRYHAPDFLPKGIITRFIVAMYKYIEDQLVWRDGVVLKFEYARVEAIEFYNKREIRIRIDGSHKRDFLNIVKWELDKIFNNFNNLNYHQLIPCNCVRCQGTQSPYFYTMESLQRRMDKGRNTVECDYSYETVIVRSLIDDVTGSSVIGEEPPQVIKRLNIQFNEAELKACCFELGIDYEDLGGNGRADNARALVAMMIRIGRLPELIKYMDRERP